MSPTTSIPEKLSSAEVKELTTRYTYGTWRKQKGWSPLHVVDAEDCHFVDAAGKRYLDFSSQLMCVTLGLLVPCLLGYSIIRAPLRRVTFGVIVFATGICASALSAALSWGPMHAWAWLSAPVWLGMGLAFALALVLIALPRRGCAAMAVLALGVLLSVLNQASASAYFAHTLQAWEQGRFIRFNGLAQWLGWLWPYAALVYMLMSISRRGSPPRMAA